MNLNPVAFISSFSYAADHHQRPEDELNRLRADLAALNGDPESRNDLSGSRSRCLAWVAEIVESQLGQEKDKLLVVDRLIEILKVSHIYVAILAGKRRGTSEHGTPVDVHGPTAVSYFEIELYAAAMYNKPIFLFILDGFDPGPRLQAVIEILQWAIPGWRSTRPQSAREIYRDIVSIIRQHSSSSLKSDSMSLRSRIVNAFCRQRFGSFSATRPDKTLLFLNGFVEPRALPEPERIEELIRTYRDTTNLQKKLSRLWFVTRELLPAYYQTKEIQASSTLKRFLPYWDCVLGDWASSASWHGWHGHLYTGTIAPLNSQSIVRSQQFHHIEEFRPTVSLPPDGALASAYYSVAGLLRIKPYGWRCLLRAGKHVNKAIQAQGTPTANLLAIRGSIRLRMLLLPCAISDFREMLRLRETSGAPPTKIADAMMHLGWALAFWPLSRQGQDLLRQSVNILSEFPDNPNLPRAKRKLALAYKWAGKSALAEETMREAVQDAERIGANDQIR